MSRNSKRRIKTALLYSIAVFASAVALPLSCWADDKEKTSSPTAQEAKDFWKDMDDEGNDGKKGEHATAVFPTAKDWSNTQFQTTYMRYRNDAVNALDECLRLEKDGKNGAGDDNELLRPLSIEITSKMQLAIMKSHFHDDKGELDFTKVQSAFEMFANGELRGGDDKRGQREMNYLVNWLQWLCFAKIAIAKNIDKDKWEEMVKILEKSKQIYVDVYSWYGDTEEDKKRNQDAAKEQGKANVVNMYRFDPDKKYDDKKKEALRKKIHAMKTEDILKEFSKEVKENYVAFYVVPPTPGTAYVSQNDGAKCTYDKGTPYEVAYTPISPGSGAMASYAPLSAPGRVPEESAPVTPPGGGPSGSDKPPTATTSDNPPQQPKAADTPPPTTIADNPPTDNLQDDDEVETFDKETVEQGGHTETGSGVQTQVVMLTTAKPYPKKTEDDPGSGFDRNPAKVRIVNGHGVIYTNRADRQAFGLPDTGNKPVHVRLDLTAMKHTSALAEITGKTVKSGLASALPAGDTVTMRAFNINNRSFMALDFAQPFNHTEDVVALASRFLGMELATDICDEDKPAALEPDRPTAASGANDNALPSGGIRVTHATRSGRVQ
jgi:hypothetical protein